MRELCTYQPVRRRTRTGLRNGYIADISTGQSTQDFKYGDKQLDRTYGLDLYDFEARQYDVNVPMFTSIDPLAEKYYGISPYVYCGGDPINRINPTGMEWGTRKNDDGTTTIYVDVVFNVSGNVSQELIDSWKDAIKNTFNDMISKVSGGAYSGDVTFFGRVVDGQVTPELTLDPGNGGLQGGLTNANYAGIYYSNENGMRSTDVIASDAVHELLHTLMMDDITTTVVSRDVELIDNGNLTYSSTSNTDSGILSNIMNSPTVVIDGKTFRETGKSGTQSIMTKGQFLFMLNQIKLQQSGAGSHGISDIYWQVFPGSKLLQQ